MPIELGWSIRLRSSVSGSIAAGGSNVRLLDRAMLRASLIWDDDRMLEIESAFAKLGRRPSEISQLLRVTPHGSNWMINRSKNLAIAAVRNEGWIGDQTRLAFDQIGTAP